MNQPFTEILRALGYTLMPMMSILRSSSLTTLSDFLNKVLPSEKDRIHMMSLLEKIKQHPEELQSALNKIEAGHRSLFVAGWRPFIGWVCGFGMANTFIINPWLQWLFSIEGPKLPLDVMIELVIAMLGLGTLRTFEKFKDKAK